MHLMISNPREALILPPITFARSRMRHPSTAIKSQVTRVLQNVEVEERIPWSARQGVSDFFTTTFITEFPQRSNIPFCSTLPETETPAMLVKGDRFRSVITP